MNSVQRFACHKAVISGPRCAQEKKGKRKREAPEVAPLERFEEDELRAARLLLEEEAQGMRAALGHPLLDPVNDAPVRRVLPVSNPPLYPTSAVSPSCDGGQRSHVNLFITAVHAAPSLCRLWWSSLRRTAEVFGSVTLRQDDTYAETGLCE